MYQFSVQVQDHDQGFSQVIENLKQRLAPMPADRMLFQIYSTMFSDQLLSALIAALDEQFHGCQIVCRTVSGSVVDFEYRPGITISAVVFERPDSRTEVRAYDLTVGTDGAVAAEIKQFVRDHSWVKAVEIHRTVHNMNTTDLCRALSDLPEDIVVFGGIVCAEIIAGRLSYVADRSGRLLDHGVLVIYYGGSDLHVKSYRMSGWKPIDKIFSVTRAEDNVILEIDGAPASDIYRRYLAIEPDDAFVMNVLEFPMSCEDEGHSVIRNVMNLNSNGGLAVANHINVGAKLKVCYADAESIAEDINAVTRALMLFTPDVISVVSCITRSMIWKMKDYISELQGFKSVAPCHGYLSHGEFLREDGVFNHHNTILAAAAFREGDVREVSYPEVSLRVGNTIPLVARLSSFINCVTEELKAMYSEVEHVATTDALTGIGNRYLFDDVVKSVSSDTAGAGARYLLMFDLNGLKFVNDTYGHNEGDALIKAASDAISGVFSPYGQCFRIGGDEFAVIADFADGAALQRALKDLYSRMQAYNETAPYILSMAVGYAPLINAQGKLMSGSDWKMAADINMYLDKTKFHAIKPSFLNQNMSDFIMSIMTLTDNKNSLTAYHSIRVQRMSVMIAKLIGLEDPVVDRINLGAYLHDIGKIGISDLILTKTDRLSEEELLLLRQKPVIGRRILNNSEETKPVADIVYSCCENWDGSGYPEGLSGGDIPLEARVIAVAEFIDTALHGGYGKAARTAEECMRELQENSGRMFDPAIVSAALSSFGKIVKDELHE